MEGRPADGAGGGVLAPAAGLGAEGIVAVAFSAGLDTGDTGTAVDGAGAGGFAAARISAMEDGFRSHSGLGAFGAMPTSLVNLPKPSMSTWMVQTPSGRSRKE